ncbi:hypothetical protein D806_048620 [Mycolicibacterium smegmatis MKD8]|uniref:Transmembrane protein n=1 Tax=Mycolicibacterium smegmatis (strain MKD8) TaxID=1214915 RepID=A0A2U9PVM8_MYCSE|nr:hypothetical protein D806_048620 [Mycolicibacterium smegmatis MKD8]
MSMSKYASRLQALAEGKAEGEMVLAKHVELAVTELSSDEELPLKTVVDWLKRVAFLFVGFTVVQGINVFRPDQLDRGSVKWFIADLIITTALVAIAFILDFPIVRDYFRRRAGK